MFFIALHPVCELRGYNIAVRLSFFCLLLLTNFCLDFAQVKKNILTNCKVYSKSSDIISFLKFKLYAKRSGITFSRVPSISVLKYGSAIQSCKRYKQKITRIYNVLSRVMSTELQHHIQTTEKIQKMKIEVFSLPLYRALLKITELLLYALVRLRLSFATCLEGAGVRGSPVNSTGSKIVCLRNCPLRIYIAEMLPKDCLWVKTSAITDIPMGNQ